LQRARTTMRAQLPTGRQNWAPAAVATDAERSLLQGFMGAWERADAAALVAMLREDARLAMPPAPLWFDGRAAIARLFQLFPMDFHGDVRMVPTTANRQPAAVTYLRPHGESVYGLTALNVLRIENGAIAEITTFSPALLHA